ncbi:hypothetical protein HG530_009280 [Fusarium avenaceum]|nr:hypothetical protein HG530_009280 [Fusarium avenaceum]
MVVDIMFAELLRSLEFPLLVIEGDADLSKLAEEQEACLLQIIKLHGYDRPQMFKFLFVTLVVLNVDPPCGDEDGFEPDSFGANIFVPGRLATFTQGANSLQVFPIEAVLITLNHNMIRMNLEGDEGEGLLVGSLPKSIILGILKKLKDKPCATSIYVFRQPDES